MQCASICNTRLADSNAIYRTLPKVMTQHIIIIITNYYSSAQEKLNNLITIQIITFKLISHQNWPCALLLEDFHDQFLWCQAVIAKIKIHGPETVRDKLAYQLPWTIFYKPLRDIPRSERSFMVISWKLRWQKIVD